MRKDGRMREGIGGKLKIRDINLIFLFSLYLARSATLHLIPSCFFYLEFTGVTNVSGLNARQFRSFSRGMGLRGR